MNISAGYTGANMYQPEGGMTMLLVSFPSDGTGVIDTIRIGSNTNEPIKVGSFYLVDGTTYVERDHVDLGSIGGGVITVGSLNLQIAVGDVLGVYSPGYLREDYVPGTTQFYNVADCFDKAPHEFHNQGYWGIELMGTGATVETPPEAPEAPSSVNSINKVTITWTAGVGETGGHRVYRDGTDISGIIAHGTNTFDDVPPDTGTHSYTVKAINNVGLSSASSVVTSGGGVTKKVMIRK